MDMANPVFQWSARTAHVAAVAAVRLAFLDPGKLLLAELAHGEASMAEVLVVRGLRIRLVAEMALAETPVLTNNKLVVAVVVDLLSQAVTRGMERLVLGHPVFSHS